MRACTASCRRRGIYFSASSYRAHESDANGNEFSGAADAYTELGVLRRDKKAIALLRRVDLRQVSPQKNKRHPRRIALIAMIGAINAVLYLFSKQESREVLCGFKVIVAMLAHKGFDLGNVVAPACGGKVDTCRACHIKARLEVVDHQYIAL